MEDKKAAAIARGKRAELLLQDELLNESLSKMEADYIAKWRTTKVMEADARERLWQAVQIVGLVRDHLTNVMSNGKLTQAALDEIVQPQKRGIFGL